MVVWLVQRFVGGVWDERGEKWGLCEFEITGIFDSEQKAIDACLDHNYVVAPIEINYTFPEERVKIPGSYYPKAQKRGDT
ncbi:MAG: hypothetical protein H6Q69_921 [Firmicutes bacterium]|nr:hypothetical protein [Bacillota bacterium]